MKLKQGWVYIAKCEDRYKIGWTGQDPEKRIAGLRTGNPFPVELVGIVRGTIALESTLHRHFASKRSTGEWFFLEPDDIEYIFSLAPQPRMLGGVDLDELELKLSRSSPQVQRAFVAAVNKARGK